MYMHPRCCSHSVAVQDLVARGIDSAVVPTSNGVIYASTHGVRALEQIDGARSRVDDLLVVRAPRRMSKGARARIARWAASTVVEAPGAAPPPSATCMQSHMPPLVLAPRLPQIVNVPSSNVQPSPKGPPPPLAPKAKQPPTSQSLAQTMCYAPKAPTRKRKNGGRAKDPEKVPPKYRGPCCHGIKEWGVKESDGPGDRQQDGTCEWYCYACMYILDKPE